MNPRSYIGAAMALCGLGLLAISYLKNQRATPVQNIRIQEEVPRSNSLQDGAEESLRSIILEVEKDSYKIYACTASVNPLDDPNDVIPIVNELIRSKTRNPVEIKLTGHPNDRCFNFEAIAKPFEEKVEANENGGYEVTVCVEGQEKLTLKKREKAYMDQAFSLLDGHLGNKMPDSYSLKNLGSLDDTCVVFEMTSGDSESGGIK